MVPSFRFMAFSFSSASASSSFFSASILIFRAKSSLASSFACSLCQSRIDRGGGGDSGQARLLLQANLLLDLVGFLALDRDIVPGCLLLSESVQPTTIPRARAHQLCTRRNRQ